MVVAPFVSFLKKIELLDSEHFNISGIFSRRTYSANDVEKILICKRWGTKYSMYIFTKDNKNIWVSTTFWSNRYFEELRSYFTEKKPDKVENQLLAK